MLRTVLGREGRREGRRKGEKKRTGKRKVEKSVSTNFLIQGFLAS